MFNLINRGIKLAYNPLDSYLNYDWSKTDFDENNLKRCFKYRVINFFKENLR